MGKKKKAAAPPEIKVKVTHRVEHILDIEKAVNTNIPIVVFEVEHVPTLVVPVEPAVVLRMHKDFDKMCAQVFKRLLPYAAHKAVEIVIHSPAPEGTEEK